MNLFLNILGILCILGLVCLIIICVVSHIENRQLTVTEYEIKDDRIPKLFHGCHIVQLSDMHNVSFGKDNIELIEAVKRLQPDILVVTGDAIVGKPGEDVIHAANTINALVDIAPVYFSLGNHELRTSLYKNTYGSMWEDFRSCLSPKVHVLSDERACIWREEDCMYLYGVSLNPRLYRRFFLTPMEEDYLTGIFGECEPNTYHVFLAHNPDYFPDYASWGANLTFSGHVHGGMIRLPILGGLLSPMIRFFPKYDKGLFCENNKYMILSGGLGNHTFKFRVNNKPEIVSVKLFHR